MAVTTSDIKHYQSANMPADDTSTVGGAATTSAVSSSIGGVFHKVIAPAEGESDVAQYKKTFISNINETDDLTSGILWLANALDDIEEGSEGVITVTSDSADDDSDYYIRVVGFDLGDEEEEIDPAPQTEEILLNGTTGADGTLDFSRILWVEVRDVATGALSGANGNITIEADSVELGVIPAGLNCGLACVDIGLAATLDDSATIANALTAPGAIVFTRPNASDDSLAIANSGTLTAESGQGIWWMLTVAAGAPPAAELNIRLSWQGEAV